MPNKTVLNYSIQLIDGIVDIIINYKKLKKRNQIVATLLRNKLMFLPDSADFGVI